MGGTDAVEEYEDALLAAFGAAVGAGGANQSDAGVVLPFANLRRPTGERRVTGISGSLLPRSCRDPRASRPTCGRGRRRRRGRARRTATAAGPDRSGAGHAAGHAPGHAGEVTLGWCGGERRTSATLTADGAKRLQAELTELTEVKRPQVIGRIRSAKELGDLKENADYHAAREEQSFLEGRIRRSRRSSVAR